MEDKKFLIASEKTRFQLANYIASEIEKGNIHNIVDLVSGYMGVPPGSRVYILCLTCREIFVDQDYREFAKHISLGKVEGYYEKWRYDIQKHFLENLKHEIVCVGLNPTGTVGSLDYFNFSEGFRKERESALRRDLKILERENKETRF